MSERVRPYLIKSRIFDRGLLWGVIAESNNTLYKIEITRMLTMQMSGIPFLVDYPHADKPSVLTLVHRLHKDGMTYFFKAIGDKNLRNNFSRVPKINLKDVDIQQVNWSPLNLKDNNPR